MKAGFHSIVKLSVICWVCIWVGCNAPSLQPVWSNVYPRIGSSASPQCIDLNLDGTLDMVLGAGKNEFEVADTGLIALDGESGTMLWHLRVEDQLIGTPVFQDITSDGVPDIFIGGRSAQFLAVDGQSGKRIWSFTSETSPDVFQELLRFNFYTAQRIPDQNQDGFEDLLVSHGGNVHAPATDTTNRYPGVLLVLDSRSGLVLAADTMPDGRETYMSPIVHDFEGNGELSIIFGTGGETIGGHLYKAPLELLLHKQLNQATALLHKDQYGFIAPPLLADLNEDGIKDIIVNWFGGETHALDGASHQHLWTHHQPETESYASLTPGIVNQDHIPDLFTTYCQGKWPENTQRIQVVINGKNGQVIQADSLGCAGYGSAVSMDMNGDGYTEFLFQTNHYNCEGIFLGEVKTDLVLWDVQHDSYHYIFQHLAAKNVSTTPWIGDLDNNGMLDIIYSVQANTTKMHTYFGMQIGRLATQIPMDQASIWGAYMGSESNGIH